MSKAIRNNQRGTRLMGETHCNQKPSTTISSNHKQSGEQGGTRLVGETHCNQKPSKANNSNEKQSEGHSPHGRDPLQ